MKVPAQTHLATLVRATACMLLAICSALPVPSRAAVFNIVTPLSPTVPHGQTLAVDLSGYFIDPATVNGTVVTFNTSQGSFNVTLFDQDAPATVTNFLNYIHVGAYNNDTFHLLSNVTQSSPFPRQILQGGGFSFSADPSNNVTGFNAVPLFAPIQNESNDSLHPNAAGTLSMAHGVDPNSATSEFFFNVVDNSSALAASSGTGSAVLGMTDGTGLSILQGLANNYTPTNVSAVTGNASFFDFPLANGFTPASNFPTGAAVFDLAAINSITVANPPTNPLLYNIIGNSDTSIVQARLGSTMLGSGLSADQLQLVAGNSTLGTAIITLQIIDKFGLLDTQQFPVTVTGSVDLGVNLAGPPVIIAGAPVTYSLLAFNNDTVNAKNISVTDNFPPALTGVTWTCVGAAGGTCSAGGAGNIADTVSLPSGGSVSYTITATLSPSATGTLSDIAAIAPPPGSTDPIPSDNTSTSPVASVETIADVGVVLTGPGTVIAGNNLSYTVTATNSGPSDAQGGVTITDTLPPGTTFVSMSQNTGPTFGCSFAGGTESCTIATLPSGASATFTLTIGVGASVTGTISNIANITSPTDTNITNDSSAASATVTANADLSVTNATAPTVTAGGNAVYSITVTNAGPSDSQAVALTDTLPPGTSFVSMNQNTGPSFSCGFAGGTESCTIATLASGATATFALTASVGASVTGTVSNTANVSSATTDLNTLNNSSTASATVGANADLSVIESTAPTVTAGGNAVYSITVANAGPSNAQSVTLTDTLPPGTAFVSLNQVTGPAFSCGFAGGTASCTIATLASGATATFTLTAGVGPSVTGTVSDTASISSATTDLNTLNNSSTASATVGASADLSVTKTAATTVAAGGNIVYNIAVANGGPSNAVTVTLTDALPPGTTFVSLLQNTGPAFACTTPASGAGGTVSCTIATLASGASGSFALTTSAGTAAVGATINNTASVASATTDANALNNSASASTTVGAVNSFTAPSATGTGNITASFTGGGPNCSFVTPQFIGAPPGASPVPPSLPGAGVVFPQGLFDFRVTGCTSASTITLTITYPQSIEGATYWKYGPTVANPTAHWYPLPATIAGNSATFSISDGGVGDDDLAANGTIADQGGPAFSPITAVPTLSEWALILLGSLIAFLGMLRIRRRD